MLVDPAVLSLRCIMADVGVGDVNGASVELLKDEAATEK